MLPLDKKSLRKLLVLGKLADKGNTGDHGSSRVYPAHTITPLAGLQAALPDCEVMHYSGEDLEKSKELAKQADAVVFVVGHNHDDEGEFVAAEESENYTESTGGDRWNGLGLHAEEVQLLKEVGPENANSIAVLIGGNMIMISEWKDSVAAILMAFYPGQEGGTALAQILCGDVNPSGKLPFVLPLKEDDLPPVDWDTTNQYYDYYHGYTRLEKNGTLPLLPFGYGLSYTSFVVGNAAFSESGGILKASCTVQNTGEREGTEVVQMYVGYNRSKVERPVKQLRGFARVTLKPGERKQVEIECPVEKLAYYNPKAVAFTVESMEYEIYIGTSSAPADLRQGSLFIAG